MIAGTPPPPPESSGFGWYLASTSSWFGAWGLQQVLFPWLVVGVLEASAETTGVVQMSVILATLVLLPVGGIVADRVELVRPSPEALRAFVGDYYSEELGTTYTIALKNNRLVARHRRNDDVALTPTAADQFASFRWWFRAVVFTRDDHGEVTGFRLTGGRVRNLRFDRVS